MYVTRIWCTLGICLVRTIIWWHGYEFIWKQTVWTNFTFHFFWPRRLWKCQYPCISWNSLKTDNVLQDVYILVLFYWTNNMFDVIVTSIYVFKPIAHNDGFSKTAVTPLLTHWSYWGLALRHGYISQWTATPFASVVAYYYDKYQVISLVYCQLKLSIETH